MSEVEEPVTQKDVLTHEEMLIVLRADRALQLAITLKMKDPEDAEKQAADLVKMIKSGRTTPKEAPDTLTLNLQVKNFHVDKEKNPLAAETELDPNTVTFTHTVTFTRTIKLMGTFWAIDNAINFIIPNTGVGINLSAPEGLSDAKAGEHLEILRELNARNFRLGLSPSPNLNLTDDVKTQISKPALTTGRKGSRLNVKPAVSLKAPTAEPAKDAYILLQSGQSWRSTENGDSIWAQRGKTQLKMDCDTALGLGPEIAIQQIAQYGPSVAQSFLALSGLWIDQKSGQPRDSYLEASVTDLLRYMGRKDKGHGGYENDDIMTQGRNIYLLSRISVPQAKRQLYSTGKRKIVEQITITRLFIVDEQAIQRALDFEGNEMQSVVSFRFHLGSVLYNWLCGDNPQYTIVSGKLLRYHSTRDKYHILLGFCLSYYDRVNMKKKTNRKISLPSLLQLANLEIPPRNTSRFLDSIKTALDELSQDGVIPGLRLKLPSKQYELSARELINNSFVEFPPICPTIAERESSRIAS